MAKQEFGISLLTPLFLLENTVILNPTQVDLESFITKLKNLPAIDGQFEREFRFHKSFLTTINASLSEELGVTLESLLSSKGVAIENDFFTIKLSVIIAAIKLIPFEDDAQ